MSADIRTRLSRCHLWAADVGTPGKAFVTMRGRKQDILEIVRATRVPKGSELPKREFTYGQTFEDAYGPLRIIAVIDEGYVVWRRKGAAPALESVSAFRKRLETGVPA